MSKTRRNMISAALLASGAGAVALAQAGGASADPAESDAVVVAAASTVSTSQRVVDIAREQLRTQNPGTFYSEGQYQAWCANFVSWVLKQAGEPLSNTPTGSWRVPGVYALKDTFSRQGELESPGYKPRPGDVVLYGGSGHTNIVVDVQGDTITTVGGNESNRVSTQTMSRFNRSIIGFGRVNSAVVEDPVVTEPEPVAAPDPNIVPRGFPGADPALVPDPQAPDVVPAVFDTAPPLPEPTAIPPAPEMLPPVELPPLPAVDIQPVVFDVESAEMPSLPPVVDVQPVVFAPPAPEVLPPIVNPNEGVVVSAAEAFVPGDVIQMSDVVEGVPHSPEVGSLPGPA